MNTKTTPGSPANHAAVSLTNGQTPNAAPPVDFNELYSYAMDQALGMEKASLNTVLGLSSCVFDIYKNAFCCTPMFGSLLETAAHAFASCMELQLSLLTLMGSHVSDTMETLSGLQAQLTAEVLERSMDIAIGARMTAPSSTVATNSASQAQPTAEVAESRMEIAIEARAS